IHALEVAFERIYVGGPEPTELIQPGIDFLKWSWFQPIETPLCVHRGFYEAGIAQHAQVLRHRRLRHPKPTLDLSHRLLGGDQQAQDRAPIGLGNDFEDRLHDYFIYSNWHIRVKVYISLAIGRAINVRKAINRLERSTYLEDYSVKALRKVLSSSGS